LWNDVQENLNEIAWKRKMMLRMESKVKNYSELQDKGDGEEITGINLNCFQELTEYVCYCSKCCRIALMVEEVTTSMQRMPIAVNHSDQDDNNQQQKRVKEAELIKEISMWSISIIKIFIWITHDSK